MPATSELQVLLNKRLRMCDAVEAVTPSVEGVTILRGVTPKRDRGDTGASSPGSLKSGDAAAGGPAPIQHSDSTSSFPRPAGTGPSWEGEAQQWKRACVWSSRARMCNAQIRTCPNTPRQRALSDSMNKAAVTTKAYGYQENERVQQLNQELLQRVRQQSEESEKVRASQAKKAAAMDEVRLQALARQHEDAFEELSLRLSMESQKSEYLATKLEELQQCRKVDSARSSEWVEKLREDCHELRGRNQYLESSRAQLREEIALLRASMGASAVATKSLKAKPETTPEVEVESEPEATCAGSEGRLRAALTGRGVSTEELREAIASVEALLSEAKRELASRDLRERRAAYERLHLATQGDKDQELEEAIYVARQSGVDDEDLIKAECKLLELRSLSDEERAAQAAAKHLAEAKRRSFQLVKRGEAAALKEVLRGFEMEGPGGWKSWKDHAGRSLLAYAKEARSEMVKECLQRMVAPSSSQPERSSRAPEVVTALKKLPKSPASPSSSLPDRQSRVTTEESDAPASPSPKNSPVRSRLSLSPDGSFSGSHWDEDDETAALKAAAFRAVVKDDTKVLHEVLERFPREMWNSWTNKAGRGLVTLSEERRATGCYVMLCRDLGVLQERKREAFCENETVWILWPGEVQPKHATVLEDTSSEDEFVLVQIWDAEGPPERVDYSVVLKAH